MQVQDFESEPTKKRHPSYEGSLLYTTAPEWSTGEVLLAAAYRRLVLGVNESTIDLENIARTPALMPAGVGGRDVWMPLLTERGGIASPLRHGQFSPTASRQLMPLVPTIARIAGVLGKRPRSRWNPSNLLLETIGAGRGKADGEALVVALGEALEVAPTDDVFARYVEDALRQGLQGVDPVPVTPAPFRQIALGDDVLRARRLTTTPPPRLCPAERFCADLPAVLAIKPSLTRRQWTVLLEAMLRLGLGMHVLWTCNANILAWEQVLAVASGGAPPSAPAVELAIWETHDEARPLLELGADAESLVERMIELYAYARTGLNLLLCRLDDAGVSWAPTVPIGFSTTPQKSAPVALAEFLAHVHANRQAIDAIDAGQWLRAKVGGLFDSREDLRALAQCDSGYTKNLFEFARHSLGQVKAKDPDQRCYDLSYLLAYADERKPLPVQPGPAMLVALVHACCWANPAIPVSLDDFRRHLGDYGLRVPAGELVHGKTGRDLSMLGLVVDSPDAAGGRLLVKPF
jgi:hypothetical protein